MTGPEQYDAAESLLDAVDERDTNPDLAVPPLTIPELLATAQVRATLALAAATAEARLSRSVRRRRRTAWEKRVRP